MVACQDGRAPQARWRTCLQLDIFCVQVCICLVEDFVAGLGLVQHLLEIFYPLVFALAIGAL